MTLTFLKSPGQVLCGISLNWGFIWCSLMIRQWLGGTGKNTTALLSPSQCFLSGAACCQYLLLCSLCLSGIYQDQCSSVHQSCPTLCDPMNRSTPGFPVHHQLLEFTQTHAHRVGDAIYISSSVVPFSSCPQSLPASGSFPMSQLFAWGGQSTGVSASASVLPVNTQDWSLGWTGWISLQSKGLSRVFSNTTVQNHQFFGT